MIDAATYKHGRILTDIRPMALWATVTWSDGTEAFWQTPSHRCLMDQFFADLVASSYVTALSNAFSVPGRTITAGPSLGTSGIGIHAANKGTVTDEEIQAALDDAVTNSLLPWPSADTCYFIFIPTTAIVLFQGGRSQTDFGGYHNLFTAQDGRTILYCVIAPSYEDADTLTESASHEFAEVITNPDPADPGWTDGADNQGRIMEICDVCFPGAVTVHGYSVALFVVSSSMPGSVTCGPVPDSIQRGQSSSARILLDRKFTKTSCLGNIIEGESALFHVQAYYRHSHTTISSITWTIDNVQPPSAQVATPGSNGQTDFIVDVFYGVTSFEVQVEVVTTLGCTVIDKRTFDVLTQDAADAQETVCAFMKRVADLAHQYSPPLPWLPPGPPPPWDLQRDFNRYPLTTDEVAGMHLLGEGLVDLARAARPLAAPAPGELRGQEVRVAAARKKAAHPNRLPSARRRV